MVIREDHLAESLKVKCVVTSTSPTPCDNFESDTKSSSATICKWCGVDKWLHMVSIESLGFTRITPEQQETMQGKGIPVQVKAMKIFGATQEDRDRVVEYLRHDKREMMVPERIPTDTSRLMEEEGRVTFDEKAMQNAIDFYDSIMNR